MRTIITDQFEKHISEDGKLGRWLNLHGLRKEAQIMEYSGSVIVDCTEDQYAELLLGALIEYRVDVISK